jgi:hypothetical protein
MTKDEMRFYFSFLLISMAMMSKWITVVFSSISNKRSHVLTAFRD